MDSFWFKSETLILDIMNITLAARSPRREQNGTVEVILVTLKPVSAISNTTGYNEYGRFTRLAHSRALPRKVPTAPGVE